MIRISKSDFRHRAQGVSEDKAAIYDEKKFVLNHRLDQSYRKYIIQSRM